MENDFEVPTSLATLVEEILQVAETQAEDRDGIPIEVPFGALDAFPNDEYAKTLFLLRPDGAQVTWYPKKPCTSLGRALCREGPERVLEASSLAGEVAMARLKAAMVAKDTADPASRGAASLAHVRALEVFGATVHASAYFEA